MTASYMGLPEAAYPEVWTESGQAVTLGPGMELRQTCQDRPAAADLREICPKGHLAKTCLGYWKENRPRGNGMAVTRLLTPLAPGKHRPPRANARTIRPIPKASGCQAEIAATDGRERADST
ncbi:hypothetical protein SAMN05216343_11619 [Oscillibacter sp. PC13]|nr:hypothetical protein SAMN05216343_11619 [Oscillibacter sp. PC13]